jgi:hypothetical protein
MALGASRLHEFCTNIPWEVHGGAIRGARGIAMLAP